MNAAESHSPETIEAKRAIEAKSSTDILRWTAYLPALIRRGIKARILRKIRTVSGIDENDRRTKVAPMRVMSRISPKRANLRNMYNINYIINHIIFFISCPKNCDSRILDMKSYR
jgi:hypothetical protein